MAQRNSGYARQTADFYPTPAWVTEALIEHALAPDAPENYRVWEPACGDNAMVKSLKSWGFKCWGTDLRGEPSVDFLAPEAKPPVRGINAIITNPPYKKDLIEGFIRKAIELMKPVDGMVAMLTRIDFDSAVTRGDLFENCPAFAGKLVLTKRIKWFDTGNKNGPSENHCWLLWDWKWEGPPMIMYGQ